MWRLEMGVWPSVDGHRVTHVSEGTFSPHLQVNPSPKRFWLPWRWRKQVPPKRMSVISSEHSVISIKTDVRLQRLENANHILSGVCFFAGRILSIPAEVYRRAPCVRSVLSVCFGISEQEFHISILDYLAFPINVLPVCDRVELLILIWLLTRPK
jgi:hypothetical protein